MIRVYLAGEMHTNWRGELDRLLFNEFLQNSGMENQVAYLLPHVTPDTDGEGSGTCDWYVVRDLLALDQCDLVFAMLNDNARGIGVSAEIGYAYAKGKPIIICCLTKVHSFDFVKKLAVTVVDNLEEGAACLRHVGSKSRLSLSSVDAMKELAL